MKIMRVFALAMVFAGTVVGAGFASGLEIWTFFGKYGILGFGGVVLSGIIISLCGAGIIFGTYKGDFTNYREFCNCIGGKRAGGIIMVLGSVFMLSVFCVMLAGSGALFSQELGYSYTSGIVFMTAICLVVFLLGMKGITAVNCLLTPLMLISITILGIFSVIYRIENVAVTYSDLLTASSSLISAIIYVSYNLLSVPPVIISMKDLIPSGKGAVTAGLTGGIILGISGLFMYLASLTPDFSHTQLPALTLAHEISDNFSIFYGITIYIAMLTTALGSGYGFISTVMEHFPKLSRIPVAIGVCVFSASISLLGFSRLVNTLYTAIGYAAILLTFLLISYSLKRLKKSEEN